MIHALALGVPVPRVLERASLAGRRRAVVFLEEGITVLGGVERRIEINEIQRFVLLTVAEDVEDVALAMAVMLVASPHFTTTSVNRSAPRVPFGFLPPHPRSLILPLGFGSKPPGKGPRGQVSSAECMSRSPSIASWWMVAM